MRTHFQQHPCTTIPESNAFVFMHRVRKEGLSKGCPLALGRTTSRSNHSISCSHFHCFQETGESASRSELIPEASTSSINARFVHGTRACFFHRCASGNSPVL